MPRSARAIITPELLSWARHSAGYELEAAAKKVPVDPAKLEMWERGEARPTIRQIRKLANAYKRPVAIFYLPDPPHGFQAMRDFRRSPDHVSEEMSPELRLSIRVAQERRQIAYELADRLEYVLSPIRIHARIHEESEQLGASIREFLGVSIEDQIKWPHGRIAFNNWRTAFEKRGLLVFQMYGVRVKEARGFSLNTEPMPVIAVNVKDSYPGRIFTLFHELVHILINNTGLCDLSEFRADSGDDPQVETFCNRVAGESLVPIPAIYHEQTVQMHSKYTDWSDEEIDTLSERFGVSREMLVRRLVLAGLADNDFYHSKRSQYQAEYEGASRAPASGGGPAPHVKTLSSLGSMFTNLVLQNFYRDNITASAVSDYLDMKLGHLGKLEAALTSTWRR